MNDITRRRGSSGGAWQVACPMQLDPKEVMETSLTPISAALNLTRLRVLPRALARATIIIGLAGHHSD